MANVDNTADGYISLPSGTPTTAPASSSYTGATSPNYSGGYYGEQTGSVGGGYDPNNPSYGNQANSIGGDVAVTQNPTVGPDFNATQPGGYDAAMGDNIYTGGGYDPSTASLTDPCNARLGASGLNPGGSSSAPPVSPSVAFQSVTGPTGAASSSENDWRVRVSLADGAQIFYKDPSGANPVMAPLIPTNGVIFPYTPQITVQHDANYSAVSPTHSNYPMPFYQNSQVQDITISGDFSVQSVTEGKYLMAAVYFFRAATKMFFGSGTNVGNPPPMVFLDGYGSHYFPHVPCVISSFQHTLSPDVDYIEVPIATSTIQNVNVNYDNLNLGQNGLASPAGSLTNLLQSTFAPSGQQTQFQTLTTSTRVPTISTIQISLKPVYSRDNLHYRFDLNKFAAGLLLQDRSRGYGGFL